MTQIALRLTAPPADLLMAAATLADRAAWSYRRLLVLALPLPLAFAFGLGMAHLNGQPLGGAALVVLYSFLGGFLGLILANRLFARRYKQLFTASSLRQKPCPVILSEVGLTFEPRQLLWSDIQGTARWRDNTLLHFSAVDALVIPDRDLPQVLSWEALAAQIEKWRNP
jgi:hypothetical protein